MCQHTDICETVNRQPNTEINSAGLEMLTTFSLSYIFEQQPTDEDEGTLRRQYLLGKTAKHRGAS